MMLENLSYLVRSSGDNVASAALEMALGGWVNVNSQDAVYGSTPLHHAMYHNFPSLVRLLLAQPDTKLDITNKQGRSPLHDAVYGAGASLLPLLCQDARCTPELLNLKDRSGRTAVMAGVMEGNLVSLQQLAGVAGVDWDVKDSQGNSLTMVARKLRGDPMKKAEIVTFLEERREKAKDTKIEALETELVKLRNTERSNKENLSNRVENLEKIIESKLINFEIALIEKNDQITNLKITEEEQSLKFERLALKYKKLEAAYIEMNDKISQKVQKAEMRIDEKIAAIEADIAVNTMKTELKLEEQNEELSAKLIVMEPSLLAAGLRENMSQLEVQQRKMERLLQNLQRLGADWAQQYARMLYQGGPARHLTTTPGPEGEVSGDLKESDQDMGENEIHGHGEKMEDIEGCVHKDFKMNISSDRPDVVVGENAAGGEKSTLQDGCSSDKSWEVLYRE